MDLSALLETVILYHQISSHGQIFSFLIISLIFKNRGPDELHTLQLVDVSSFFSSLSSLRLFLFLLAFHVPLKPTCLPCRVRRVGVWVPAAWGAVSKRPGLLLSCEVGLGLVITPGQMTRFSQAPSKTVSSFLGPRVLIHV